MATLEFPHIERLIAENQFDTIYHEHFSYLSATVVDRIARMHGLRLFDVEKLSTHGGSLRVYLARQDLLHPTNTRVLDLIELEDRLGLRNLKNIVRLPKRLTKQSENCSRSSSQSRGGKTNLRLRCARQGQHVA